jgi:hypothetical protein
MPTGELEAALGIFLVMAARYTRTAGMSNDHERQKNKEKFDCCSHSRRARPQVAEWHV